MAEMWAAEQLQSLRRRVAIKLIRRGMDTQHVIARFEAEP
jgi:predicted transcriptional regulator